MLLDVCVLKTSDVPFPVSACTYCVTVLSRTSWKLVFLKREKKCIEEQFCILATFYDVKRFDKMLFFRLFFNVVHVVTVPVCRGESQRETCA